MFKWCKSRGGDAVPEHEAWVFPTRSVLGSGIFRRPDFSGFSKKGKKMAPKIKTPFGCVITLAIFQVGPCGGSSLCQASFVDMSVEDHHPPFFLCTDRLFCAVSPVFWARCWRLCCWYVPNTGWGSRFEN